MRPLVYNIIVLIGLLFVSSCATSQSVQIDNTDTSAESTPTTQVQWDPNYSPLERYNRSVFQFNQMLDKNILRPTAVLYKDVTPDKVEQGLSRFFINVSLPLTIINDVLQWKMVEAIANLGRFTINSTVGILGFVDVASSIGIPKYRSEDLGQTLAVWGVPQGPYIELPFLGPKTVLSAFSSVAELTTFSFTNYVGDDVGLSQMQRYGITGLDFVKLRASLLAQEDIVSGDRFEFFKEAYLQNRTFNIKDGNVEMEQSEDLDWLDE